MIEWALIAFAIAAPVSAAVTKIHAARLEHKRREAEKPLECPHMWNPWDKDATTKVWGENTEYPTTHHIRHKRTCELCGDIDYKTWDTSKSVWLTK